MTYGEVLGLHTDLYEIRMVQSYLRLGMTEPATFSVLARPSRSRPWLLAAGVERALDLIDRFGFGADDLAYLERHGVNRTTLDWLAATRPQGEVWAVEEGTVVLATEPLLELTAPLPLAQLLEAAVLNAVHFETLIATKAARLVGAARGCPVVDFGLRRAHGLEAGDLAARAAYIGGCTATSNVAAARRFGIPVSGTMAHSFVQACDDEVTAFREFARDHNGDVTLLVDTYDTRRGVHHAIAVAKELAAQGHTIQALRLDSEPLLDDARYARDALDRAGLAHVRLFASGGLDEVVIDTLVRADAPIDGFGVGSALTTSSDKPALDIAYKLVEYAGRGCAKYSAGKAILPGAKQVFRTGSPAQDVLERRGAHASGAPLLRPVWRDGRRPVVRTVEDARTRARAQLRTLPADWRLPPGPDTPPLPTVGPDLASYADTIRRRLMPAEALSC